MMSLTEKATLVYVFPKQNCFCPAQNPAGRKSKKHKKTAHSGAVKFTAIQFVYLILKRVPLWRSLTAHRWVAVLQVVGLILMVGWSLGMFSEMHTQILEHNKSLPIEQQAQPYDLTSLQKYSYELFIPFLDVPMSFIKLLLIAPFVLYYLLPFIKTGKKDFITEFFEELTPYQRCVLTVILLALCFFSVSLAHTVKP